MKKRMFSWLLLYMLTHAHIHVDKHLYVHNHFYTHVYIFTHVHTHTQKLQGPFRIFIRDAFVIKCHELGQGQL